MLITSKTTSTNSDDELIIISIPGIKTHDYSINISEPRILSPRYLKTGVITGGGIGLGIVAALDKLCSGKKPVTKFTTGSDANRPSDRIAIGVSSNTKTKGNESLGSVEMSTSTTAATAAAAATSVRSMYCDGGIYIEDQCNIINHRLKQVGVFYVSPSPPIFYNTSTVTRDYPSSDFLSSCYLCKKKLHGKDIYMYRGEKAFCSPECRYQQIAADEEKDKKRPRRRNGVSRSSFDVSSLAGAEDHLFSPGIMAI